MYHLELNNHQDALVQGPIQVQYQNSEGNTASSEGQNSADFDRILKKSTVDCYDEVIDNSHMMQTQGANQNQKRQSTSRYDNFQFTQSGHFQNLG